MTWTYIDPSTYNKDKVRVWIGDTNQDRQLLSDEDITYFLTRAGDNIFRACADCCEAIASKFARDASTRVRGNMVDIDNVWQNYKQLAKDFRTRVIGSQMPFAVIKDSQKDTLRDDTDLTKPGIRVGMTDTVDDSVHQTRSYDTEELD